MGSTALFTAGFVTWAIGSLFRRGGCVLFDTAADHIVRLKSHRDHCRSEV